MDILNLQLGHSELVYLLWLMKTLSIPGIGPKPFGDLSGEQVVFRTKLSISFKYRAD